MGLKYFGTDGVRGPVRGALLNEAWIRRFGYALGAYGKRIAEGKLLTVVVGHDTRGSSISILDYLLEGINEHQGYVLNLGIVPTPAVALSVIENHATLGIVITASHNPASDNGIKLFSAQGTKLDVSEEAAIEALVEEVGTVAERPDLRRSFPLDGLGSYITHVRSLMHQQCFKKLKVVVDCSHGATSQSTPAVLRHYGADVVVLNADPDGENINDGVGSEYPDGLTKAVVHHKADVGIAHDGDGDRVVLCDADGTIIDGDQVLGILSKSWFARKRDDAKVLVATVQSNLGLDAYVNALGGTVERVDVGDRNVAAKMRELGACIGGESSGHIILSERSTTGDGLIAAIEVMQIICESQESLGSLAQNIRLFPQETYSLRVAEKLPLESLESLQKAIDAWTCKLADEGRIMIRYSGTEAKLRFLVEAKSSELAAKVLQNLISEAESDLGAANALLTAIS